MKLITKGFISLLFLTLSISVSALEMTHIYGAYGPMLSTVRAEVTFTVAEALAYPSWTHFATGSCAAHPFLPTTWTGVTPPITPYIVYVLGDSRDICQAINHHQMRDAEMPFLSIDVERHSLDTFIIPLFGGPK